MRNISKRKSLLSATIILLFLCLGSWWFRQMLPSTSIYPNTTLINASDRYSEIGLIKFNQFQISTFTTNDSYQEVLRWFLDNDWNVFLANYESWYRLTKEETISDFYPEIRLVYYVDLQLSENNQTCITQVAYASVVVFDGKVIHRSQDYLDAGSEYYHHAPECSINANP